jgi:hypothetical protein
MSKGGAFRWLPVACTATACLGLGAASSCGARTGLGVEVTSPNASVDASADHDDAAPEASADHDDAAPEASGAPDAMSAADAPACDSVSVDFSTSGLNPSGAWSYGWSSTLGSTFAFNPYNLFIPPAATPSKDPNAAGLALWSSVELGSPSGYLPAVFFNPPGPSAVTLHPAGVYSVAPGQFGAHPGPSGQYSIARWTARAPGSYSVQATFVGLHGYGGGPVTTTDVHVLHDNDDIAPGNINLNGSGNTFTSISTVDVAAGDTLDFAVGYGSDGNYYSDSTGLNALVCGLP